MGEILGDATDMTELPRSAQIIVVGGGIVGCSVAYHLAKRGVETLLLERHRLTSGSTWHAAGLVGQLRTNANITRLLGYSVELYEKLEAETGTMQGVFIVDSREPKEQRVVIAREGRLYSDPERLRILLKLQDGSTHIAPADSPGRYRVLNFGAYDLGLEMGRVLTDPIDRPLGEQELTIAELRERAARLRADGKNYRPPLVEMHKKVAIPVACLLFGLVGPPLGIRVRRGGRAASLVLSIGFALGYYLLIVAGEGLGTRGYLPPAWAMWLPNAILAAVGGYLLVSGAQEGLWRGRVFWRPQRLRPAT